MKHQTPNTKHQQTLKSKTSTGMHAAVRQRFGWCLEVGSYLVFGVWCLVFWQKLTP
jgi:hypothetical protein